MKKIFIVLLFGFLVFIPLKSSAFNFADEYGTYMTYKTLSLDVFDNDFEFTGNWYANSTDTTYVFEYKPLEESLEELIRQWQHATSVFMDVYHTYYGSYPYLSNLNMIPYDDNNIGWAQDDGHIYIIIKQDWFYEGEDILPQMGDLAENIRVDTWVITDSSPDYQEGYDLGYNNGYTDGYSDGFITGDEQSYDRGYYFGYNTGFDSGYDQGYDDGIQDSEGYEQGYEDGANESFIGSIDKWLVPAVIIVMILGGFFAIARKKRDGDI